MSIVYGAKTNQEEKPPMLRVMRRPFGAKRKILRPKRPPYLPPPVLGVCWGAVKSARCWMQVSSRPTAKSHSVSPKDAALSLDGSSTRLREGCDWWVPARPGRAIACPGERDELTKLLMSSQLISPAASRGCALSLDLFVPDLR